MRYSAIVNPYIPSKFQISDTMRKSGRGMRGMAGYKKSNLSILQIADIMRYTVTGWTLYPLIFEKVALSERCMSSPKVRHNASGPSFPGRKSRIAFPQKTPGSTPRLGYEISGGRRVGHLG